MIKYIKFYFEPKRQDILEMATFASREWFAANPGKRSMSNYQEFCRSYESAYRHTYAKSKMKGGL
jgi:hypothetical protein